MTRKTESLRNTLLTAALLLIAVGVGQANTHAQAIYVIQGDHTNGLVSEYSTSGSPIAPNLVPLNAMTSGLGNIIAAVGERSLSFQRYDGQRIHNRWCARESNVDQRIPTSVFHDRVRGNLFIADNHAGTVGEYTAAGVPINPRLDLVSECQWNRHRWRKYLREQFVRGRRRVHDGRRADQPFPVFPSEWRICGLDHRWRRRSHMSEPAPTARLPSTRSRVGQSTRR